MLSCLVITIIVGGSHPCSFLLLPQNLPFQFAVFGLVTSLYISMGFPNEEKKTLPMT